MKTKSLAVRRRWGTALRSSSSRQTKLERAKSSARLLKLLHQPDGGSNSSTSWSASSSQKRFSASQWWLGALHADRCAWLSRAFRLGGRGCPLRTAGRARCCRPQKDSARQNLYVCLPAALSHCGKNAAPGRGKVHSRRSIGCEAAGAIFPPFCAGGPGGGRLQNCAQRS